MSRQIDFDGTDITKLNSNKLAVFRRNECGFVFQQIYLIDNLKKAKGQYLSFGIIICLTALIMNIALVLAFQTFSAYDRRFSELDTADINFMIPQLQDDKELITEIEKIDGVSTVKKHDDIFVSAIVREFADSDFDMNTVFYNLDEERTINRLDVSEQTKTPFIYQCI